MRLLIAATGIALISTPGYADVVISSAPTQNMNCSAGVCVPTASDAVLNVGDLETLLSSGNVEVTTTGSGVQANNIDVTDSLSWTEDNGLAFDCFKSLTISAAVGDKGNGSFSIKTNDGGSGGMVQFLLGGSISFSNLADTLTINSTNYKLESDIKSLAIDVLDHPSRSFALANDVDARKRIYRSSPISTYFSGNFTGLGHTISNLQIADEGSEEVGLFAAILAHGTVTGLGLNNVHIAAAGPAGGVAGSAMGTISNTWVTGKIAADGDVGGLVAENYGSVSGAWTSADITSEGGNAAGGLIGTNDGNIEGSFANGNVSGSNAGVAGGLVGLDGGAATSIEDSYATGDVTVLQGFIGGAIGYAGSSDQEVVVDSMYAIGRVKKGTTIGGFLGYNYGHFQATDCYWDTSTNSKNTQGVGSGSGEGIQGLTSRKLRSRLPKGFKPNIWAEDPNINNGYPYLIANPPR